MNPAKDIYEPTTELRVIERFNGGMKIEEIALTDHKQLLAH
jgi:hypothetical protein